MGEAARPGVLKPSDPFIGRSRRRIAALAAAVVFCHAFLLGMGATLSMPALAQLDALGVEQLTRRFEPALAPGLFAALGPQPPVFIVLAVFLVFAALLRRWRSAPRTLLAAALALLLALELWGAGTLVFDRAAPVAIDPALPVPEDWRAPWQSGGSYPNRHALLTGALAASALIAWVPLGLPAFGLALCGAATAVYFGAAHVSDGLLGLVLGLGAGVAGRLGAALVWSGRLR